MMRISSNQLFKLGVSSIQRQQAQMSQTSLQLASGKRILAPSDDPTGTVVGLRLTTAIETASQYQDNAIQAQARLNLEETTLEELGAGLQRVRELALRGNNDSLSTQDRGFIATEIEQRLQELLGLANSQDANGEYIFAGSHSQTLPFAKTVTGFDYAGDDLPRSIQMSPVRQVAIGDSGRKVFMDIPNGNGDFTTAGGAGNTGTGVIGPGTVTDPAQWGAGADVYTISFTAVDAYEIRDSANTLVTSGAYVNGGAIDFQGVRVTIQGQVQSGDTFSIAPSTGQSLFQTYQNLADTLGDPGATDADSARFHIRMNAVLTDLDQAAENIFKTRADVGARLNLLDSQSELNESTLLTLRQTLSETQDLDYAEAISRLKSQLAGLQAAQQSYIQVQRLSLFDYLR